METQQQEPLTKQKRRELRRQKNISEQQQRKLKRLYRRMALWLSIAFVVGGSIFGAVQLALRPAQDTGPAITVDAINSGDWVKGNQDAKVVLIEYGDFQCPACAFYGPLLKKLSEEFADELAIAYRHFPLPNHQNAKPAAYAAEASGLQGKFWEMHDMIFDNQKEWKDKRNPEEVFTNYAQILNLNIEQFKEDFASKEIRKKIDDAYKNAVKLGLDYTPTFFLNGKRISNSRNYEDFRNSIRQNLNLNE